MSKASKHMERVRSLGCLICREVLGVRDAPASAHHVFQKRSDWLTVPLCPEHHQGKTGFHGLGQREFERRYNIDEEDLLSMTIEALHR